MNGLIRTAGKIELTDRRRIHFYPAVFGTPATITERDAGGGLVKYREVIAPGAFDDALRSADEVLATVDHDPARTFAKRSDGSLILQADRFGLYASTWLPETEFGESVRERVAAGELNGCSFQFLPVRDRHTEAGEVERVSVRLLDVCLTSNPAYKATLGEVHLRTDPAASRLAYLLARYRYLKIK